MANSRLRFLMPHRTQGPTPQSSDLSAPPERTHLGIARRARGYRIPAGHWSASEHALRLEAGFPKYGTSEELQRYLRDVVDHATTVVERVNDFQKLLTGILTVNATPGDAGPERRDQ